MANAKTLEQFNRDHLKMIYAAIQDQLSKVPLMFNLFGIQHETHRWYECGEVYQSRSGEAICHKYTGHPGRHAMRRRTSIKAKLGKRA